MRPQNYTRGISVYLMNNVHISTHKNIYSVRVKRIIDLKAKRAGGVDSRPQIVKRTQVQFFMKQILLLPQTKRLRYLS